MLPQLFEPLTTKTVKHISCIGSFSLKANQFRSDPVSQHKEASGWARSVAPEQLMALRAVTSFNFVHQ
jgi:hypothetical protein